jgi:hypothetical protein
MDQIIARFCAVFFTRFALAPASRASPHGVKCDFRVVAWVGIPASAPSPGMDCETG